MNDRQGSKEGEALLCFLCMFPKMRRINENSKTFVYTGVFPCLLWSCEKEGTDQQYVEVPEGFALSAGTATNFLTSSKAYDFEASWLSGIYSSRFNDGDGLYDDVRTSSNQDGGLGPVYAGYSCGSCHRNAGRTKPTLWSEGGSGNYGFFFHVGIYHPKERSVLPELWACAS